MPFAYDLGSAPDIATFFTQFEAFITGIGWTVEQGSGTTDLIIRSLGEEGDYTMLWAHVRKPGAPNTIAFDVQDDLAGTHTTTGTTLLNLTALPFDWWMNGDMEFINVCTRNATPNWDYAGFGCLWEFALDIDDETYKMVTNRGMRTANILRWHTGAWNVAIGVYNEPNSNALLTHPQDGSLTFMGLYEQRQEGIAGEVPHISGQLNPPFFPTETVISSKDEGGQTAWIVLQDDAWLGGGRFAMRTGGVLPTGDVTEGSFAGEEMVSINPLEFITTDLPAFMTALGWTNLGDAGLYSASRLFHSQGESGADDIYIIVACEYAANDLIHIFVQDDAVGTHRTWDANMLCDENSFPMLFTVCGDKDCLLIIRPQPGPDRFFLWAGKLIPGAPDLDCAFAMVTYSPYSATFALLRDCDGNWTQGYTMRAGSVETAQSSPNAFDGITNIMWPIWARDLRAAPGGGYVMVGQFQYIYHIQSLIGLSPGDRIPVEDRNYKVCTIAAPVNYAVRIE